MNASAQKGIALVGLIIIFVCGNLLVRNQAQATPRGPVTVIQKAGFTIERGAKWLAEKIQRGAMVTRRNIHKAADAASRGITHGVQATERAAASAAHKGSSLVDH
jgi:hypothetical protein